HQSEPSAGLVKRTRQSIEQLVPKDMADPDGQLTGLAGLNLEAAPHTLIFAPACRQAGFKIFISMSLSTKYNPAEVEEKWYTYWMENGFFHSEPNSEKEPFTIVIPPPNVTGVLHMGHMLNNTIQ